MQDEQSSEVVESTMPESDPILDVLSDTESPEAVETQEAEVSEPETEPEVEQPQQEDELAQEIDPKEEARRRYEERQAFREEQRKKIAEQTSEYTNEAIDEFDQRLRNVESQRYVELVENTQEKLVNDFERATSNPDLQIFNPKSPEFNQKLYSKAIKDFNEGYITYDTNGNMVGTKSSLYEHLKETADLYKDAIKSGAVQQVRAARQMKSNSDIKPAATPKEPAKDAILDILKSD